jgi:DNA polymerase I-like protein with 3'-5' exonuclease and polymerase domains
VKLGGLVLQVHDDFVLEVHQDRADLARQILVEEMTVAFAALLPEAPTIGLVNAHAGTNWAAARG